MTAEERTEIEDMKRRIEELERQLKPLLAISVSNGSVIYTSDNVLITTPAQQ